MTNHSPRVGALDALRGLTIVWVTAMHFAADTRGLPGAEVGPAALAGALARGEVASVAAGVVTGVLFLPGFRLDVLLFVTGLVLALGRPRSAGRLLSHRARAILPGYWLGTLMVTAVIMICAGVRAAVAATSFADEVLHGTRLARLPYEFLPVDLLISASVFGRFTSPGAVQVVSPSLWYIALVGQFYVAYPLMRWTMARLGAAWFLAACATIMLVVRVWALGGHHLGPFDASSALAAFLPFRLVSPALGMAAAPWFRRQADCLARVPRSSLVLAGAAPLLLLAGWIGSALVQPAWLVAVIGPSAAVLPAVAGLWLVASWAALRPGILRLLIWAGQASLAMLVVQDALRVVVGTAQSLSVPVAAWMWPLLPAYLALTFGVTWMWAPVSAGVASLVWPERPAVDARSVAPAPMAEANAPEDALAHQP